MTYQIASTFNCISMRKIPGENLKACEFYVQYVLGTDELNELQIVVNQDWTMDMHRDAKKMFQGTVFLQSDDPDLDNASALSSCVADTFVLECVDFPGLANFFYDELSKKVVDGCFTNHVWVEEVVLQGRRVARKVDAQ